MTQLSKMLVQFDIDEFKEGNVDAQSDVVTSLNNLKNTLSKAFQASVQMSTDNAFTYVTYEVYVASSRAPAVRELLEWITTANVKMEEAPLTQSYEVEYINSTPRFTQRVIDFLKGTGGTFHSRQTTRSGNGVMVFKFIAGEPVNRGGIANYLHHIASTEGVELIEPKKKES